MKRRFAAISGTGRYVPDRVITNAELEAQLGEPLDQWLLDNVGIASRRVMAPGQTTSDLAEQAGRRALASAGLAADEVDLILVATDTPDQISPATAAVVQHKLAARRAAAFDINCACAGWVTALDVAAAMITGAPAYRHVLVIGAYGMSRFVDWRDKRTCTLFADGAGAVVLSSATQPGLLASHLEGAGEYHDALGIYTGGAARPATAAAVAAHGAPHVEFVRKFPASFNLERWPTLVREVCARGGVAADDVRLFVFTQLNRKTIEATMDALALPRERAPLSMREWGYTGSACVPMTLDHAAEKGLVRRGDPVILCATGGGLALACALVRWTM